MVQACDAIATRCSVVMLQHSKVTHWYLQSNKNYNQKYDIWEDLIFLAKTGESKINQQFKTYHKKSKQNFNKMLFINHSSITKLHHNYGLYIGSLLIAFISKSLIEYLA